MIGRKQEKAYLLELSEREEAQLVAVYGRRRVGKTYLVRQTFGEKLLFEHTGLYKVGLAGQLDAFRASLLRSGAKDVPKLNSWQEAFQALGQLISGKKRRRIVFMDELPWMDTHKSDFVPAFEHFWNGWASAQNKLTLVFCGSATSWIIRKVLKNKGGLHNRVTGQIALAPFSLAECKAFAASMKLPYTDYDIAEAYMIFGGIPYYWSFLKANESLAQSVDRLFFAERGPLRNEYSELYASLFNAEERYLKIVETLAKKKMGLTLSELALAVNNSKGGGFSKQLEELEQCGFIRRYTNWNKKKREAIFQLIDNFTLFHFSFLANESNPDPHFWSLASESSSLWVWKGLAFERLCLQHIPQIKKALGISGVLTKVYAWRHLPNDVYPQGAQIDLIIERADRVINLCEMKWTDEEFVITKEYDAKLLTKKAVFRAVTGTRLALHLTLVSPYGAIHNKYWGDLQSEVMLEALFEEIAS